MKEDMRDGKREVVVWDVAESGLVVVSWVSKGMSRVITGRIRRVERGSRSWAKAGRGAEVISAGGEEGRKKEGKEGRGARKRGKGREGRWKNIHSHVGGWSLF